MRAVFDTNVLLAAFLTDGVCAKLLKRARKHQFSLATCPFILQEFERILAKKFTSTKTEIEEPLALLNEAVDEILRPSGTPEQLCRDKDDDNILACAREAEADYLVTGDQDLLSLVSFKGIRIIMPKDFELLFDD